MKRTLILVAVLGVAFVGSAAAFVMVQPDQLTVSVSREIQAEPAVVLPLVRDLQSFYTWSPWSDIDPESVTTFSDPSAGMGATYDWDGNEEVGQGRMTVVADEPTQVEHQLDFVRPFESRAFAKISLEPAGANTRVTWAFRQDAGFGTKAANLVMGIETMLMADYEKGLARLAPLAEVAQAAKKAEHEAEARAAIDRALAEKGLLDVPTAGSPQQR